MGVRTGVQRDRHLNLLGSLLIAPGGEERLCETQVVGRAGALDLDDALPRFNRAVVLSFARVNLRLQYQHSGGALTALFLDRVASQALRLFQLCPAFRRPPGAYQRLAERMN